MSPKDMTWDCPRHTKAKHDILRRYLGAWFPIMATQSPKIVYIDGFAGPGSYTGGEEGSPIIALRTIVEHQANITSEVFLWFIEERRDRFEHLENIVSDFAIPSNVKVFLAHGEFDKELSAVLDRVDAKGWRIVPTFVFVDPFGWTGIPFDIIKRIMANPRCEVLISFMYEHVNRFITHPDQPENVDSLFGTDHWRAIENCASPQDRLRFIHDLYRDQLTGDAGIAFVKSFEMIDSGNRTEYFLFHGTNSLRGLELMKDAMWNADPSAGTRFSDATNFDQRVLFEPEPDLHLLQKIVVEWCGGRRMIIAALERFVVVETGFRKAHIRGMLRTLETDGQLVVHTPRKAGTFPRGTAFTIRP